jgi:hypothetical protein
VATQVGGLAGEAVVDAGQPRAGVHGHRAGPQQEVVLGGMSSVSRVPNSAS